MPTDDGARVPVSALADANAVQLVEDKTGLKDGYTYLHFAAWKGVHEAVLRMG